jgi:hypothetical protein
VDAPAAIRAVERPETLRLGETGIAPADGSAGMTAPPLLGINSHTVTEEETDGNTKCTLAAAIRAKHQESNYDFFPISRQQKTGQAPGSLDWQYYCCRLLKAVC